MCHYMPIETVQIEFTVEFPVSLSQVHHSHSRLYHITIGDLAAETLFVYFSVFHSQGTVGFDHTSLSGSLVEFKLLSHRVPADFMSSVFADVGHLLADNACN